MRLVDDISAFTSFDWRTPLSHEKLDDEIVIFDNRHDNIKTFWQSVVNKLLKKVLQLNFEP